jgi:hypothetical protein
VGISDLLQVWLITNAVILVWAVMGISMPAEPEVDPSLTAEHSQANSSAPTAKV